ncbi:MAG: hypothetical protein KF752_16330 [Pirellulaceae bacterium]|nr:hypothetical protein [Pirellulaceae bacterium]
MLDKAVADFSRISAPSSPLAVTKSDRRYRQRKGTHKVNEPPIDSSIVEVAGQTGGQAPGASQSGSSRRSTGLSELLHNRKLVLAIIFLAMMFLGLPLLWGSPVFSRLEKAVWTVIVLLYSAVLITGFAAVMLWSYRVISQTLH